MSSWLSFILLVSLCFCFNDVSGARHRKEHHSAAILTGTVSCETCFGQQAPKSTHFISGAIVAVECGGDDDKKLKFQEKVKTNTKGEFEAKLPFSVAENADKIKACSVKLIKSNHPYCTVSATATSSEIHLKSKTPNSHIFSAGFFTFKPQICNQKHFPPTNKLSDQKQFGFPFPPLIPPLPFTPPPSLFPPLPFTPPPSLLPPIFPSPPPAGLFPPLPPFPPLPFPPVPSLIPSPPPPPPPEFPIPLPPLPPIPGLPPVPPAANFQYVGKTTTP